MKEKIASLQTRLCNFKGISGRWCKGEDRSFGHCGSLLIEVYNHKKVIPLSPGKAGVL